MAESGVAVVRGLAVSRARARDAALPVVALVSTGAVAAHSAGFGGKGNALGVVAVRTEPAVAVVGAGGSAFAAAADEVVGAVEVGDACACR